MNFNLSFITGKYKYLFGVIMLLLVGVICVAFSMNGSDDFGIARREIMLRKIGHELLLQSGDSTSRVLPVQKIDENEYRIDFERELTFKPEHLVKTTQRVLAADPLSADYIVNVLNTGTAGVIYGYAISNNKKDDILSCKGRVQPTARYSIVVKFKPKAFSITQAGYLLGGLPVLAFVGFIFFRSVKPPQRAAYSNQYAETISFGSVLFNPQVRQLIINNETITLTGTETRLLLIFASSPNQTIARNRLQKEIWEDEGVIVGRSLDMFISKLRKKLETAQDIKITVIRGKGYRLEIGA